MKKLWAKVRDFFKPIELNRGASARQIIDHIEGRKRLDE